MLTPIQRRSFLKRSSLVALAPTIPTFLHQTVCAAKSSDDERILVVIQLSGGNDGINTVVPVADEGYAKHRRKLRLPANDLIRVNDSVSLHPSLRGMADLLEDDRLAIVQGVGYPNPNRSHDVSMSIWQTARFQEADHRSHGWLGRAMDQVDRPSNGASHTMLVGDETVPVAIVGRKSVASSLGNLSEMTRASGLREPLVPQDDTDQLNSFVTRSLLEAYTTSDLIESVAKGQAASNVKYPNTKLGQRLETISGMIKASYGTHVYYAIQPGYDTHAGQLPTHARLLRNLGDTLKAFMDDLKETGLDQRVVVMCFSEFGRRVKENGSLGTDHGTSGPMFLAGPGVKTGLLGTTPSMSELADDGDLKVNTDFRSIYRSVLADWLRLDSDQVLQGDFPAMSVIA